MRVADITRFVFSKNLTLLSCILFIAGVGFVYHAGEFKPVDGDNGFVFPSANEWFGTGSLDITFSVLANLSAVVALYILTKFFTVLRSSSLLAASLFMFFQLANPGLSAQFYTGIMLANVVAWSMIILYSCYKQPIRTRRVFLIFLFLSGLCSTQYCYAFYLPVFLLGCAQMRIFNGRSLLAALLGTLTPWWLLFGSGIVSLEMIHRPLFTSIFTEINPEETIQLLVGVGCSTLCLVFFFSMNVMKAVAYNSRTRAYNGVFTVVGLVTLLAMLLDYRNLIVYIPTLNFCAAFECASYFGNHRGERSGIGAGLVGVIFISLYVWQIII